MVIIANKYYEDISPGDWYRSTLSIIEKFRTSTEKIVFLSPPPADKNIQECFGTRSSVPADCISRVSSVWLSKAEAERQLADATGGVWIDSRTWMCSSGGLCPAFVGVTPTKIDSAHTTKAYEELISPVVFESLQNAMVI